VSRPPGPLGALGDAFSRLARVLVDPPLPGVAVEVRPRAVAAVRLSRDRAGLAAAASVDLPAGVLSLSLTKSNVNDPIALRSALRAVLERAGALAPGPVSLVVPDPAVRLALVPAEGLGGRGREAQETARFRLHKSLPFDVRDARLAWRVLSGGQALVAVSPEEVVRGYEEPLEALGLHPGLLEPACLALASALDDDAAGDRLLVNWDDDYVSFLLLRNGEPVLVRTLPGEASPDAVARHAVGTVQFHRDRLGGDGIADVVVRAAGRSEDEAVAVLARALHRTPRLLEPWAAIGIAEHGAAAQAVAGAAACAMRRTA
jgi:hypothetical protein